MTKLRGGQLEGFFVMIQVLFANSPPFSLPLCAHEIQLKSKDYLIYFTNIYTFKYCFIFWTSWYQTITITIKTLNSFDIILGSVLHHHTNGGGDRRSCDPHESDLPPPYTENPPPVNPFYNEYSDGGGGNRSRSFDYEYHRNVLFII